jgi:hypothetical protein
VTCRAALAKSTPAPRNRKPPLMCSSRAEASRSKPFRASYPEVEMQMSYRILFENAGVGWSTGTRPSGRGSS